MASTSRTVTVEHLFLDLETCTRCRGTDRNLERALELAAPVLDALGAEAAVTRTLVASAGHAREVGLVSSPTIRVDGRDTASTLAESECAPCSELAAAAGDGCCAAVVGEVAVRCRDWPWRGSTHRQAPVGLIAAAVVTAAAAELPPPDRGAAAASGSEPAGELTGNLGASSRHPRPRIRRRRAAAPPSVRAAATPTRRTGAAGPSQTPAANAGWRVPARGVARR